MSPKPNILSLGAGIQSTACYLLAMAGEIPGIDVAIFADTQDEPASVYRHLKWLESLHGPAILVRTAGRLGDMLLNGRKTHRAALASIPAYTAGDPSHVGGGQLQRQCSTEFKSQVVERTIRRDILGLKPGQRIPKGADVVQMFGISLDEAGRAFRIKSRMTETLPWCLPVFPLVEREWTRGDCIRWLEPRVPHQTPRSACVFCPYRRDAEWMKLRETDPQGFQRAVDIDKAIRRPGAVMASRLEGKLYLHDSRRPLDEIEFKHERQFNLFNIECEGMCGL
jgi:hypothetical protein